MYLYIFTDNHMYDDDSYMYDVDANSDDSYMPVDASSDDDCHVVELDSKQSTYDTYKCIVVNVLFYRLGCAGLQGNNR